jgi:tRNA (guanine-N7-)-methyltransferase
LKTRLRPIQLDPEIAKRYLLLPRHDSERIERATYGVGTFPGGHPHYTPFDIKQVFEERALVLKSEVLVELCCGTGDFLTQCAKQAPDKSFIGVDYARPVIERAARLAAKEGLENILFYHGRIEDFLGWDFKETLFDGIFLNFPDPWPKKKHHKRRILQAEIAKKIAERLKPAHYFISATDVPELYESHVEALMGIAQLKKIEIESGKKPSPFYETVSTYEKKGKLANRPVNYTWHERV